jgi:hypothetical protein
MMGRLRPDDLTRIFQEQSDMAALGEWANRSKQKRAARVPALSGFAQRSKNQTVDLNLALLSGQTTGSLFALIRPAA